MTAGRRRSRNAGRTDRCASGQRSLEDALAVEVSKGKTANVYTDSAGTYEATFSGTKYAVALKVKILTLKKKAS